MEKHTVNESRPSTLVWASLEERFRQQVQSMLQELLEEEVTEFLGRVKSERRPAGATAGTAAAASRNGHGKPRQLSTGLGTLTVQRPRVRGLDERFESRVLPLFARRTAAVDDLLPQLYLHGLAAGDFDLALRGLLGEEAPLSPSTMLRLRSRWQGEYEAWNQRSLAEAEVVYLWADGIYVKAGLEKEKACLRVREAPVRGGGAADGRGLGAAGRLLRLPASALGASAHDQPGGVALRGGATADQCGETVQAGRECHGDAVEVAASSGKAVPEGERAGADGESGGGDHL